MSVFSFAKESFLSESFFESLPSTDFTDRVCWRVSVPYFFMNILWISTTTNIAYKIVTSSFMVVMVWYERVTRDLLNRMLIETSIKGFSVRVKKMTISRQQHGQPIWNSREKLLCFRVWSCSDPSVVLKTLLLTFLLLLLWRTPPFFMQKISNIHDNVQRLAAGVPDNDGNRAHFQDRWSLYQHRPMIDHQWQLPTKCIYWL